MLLRDHTCVIAEAGVNHNGELGLALKLIDAAAAAGADVVKFQTFRASAMISRHAAKAEYQTRTTSAAESQLEMVRKLELSEADHEALIAHAKAKGIEFLSAAFDSASLRLLAHRFGLHTIKIPSGEVTNAPFLLEVAQTGRDVILSTGMSTLGEVETALGVLAFGYTSSAVGSKPNAKAFAAAFAGDVGQKALREHVVLLHCTTEYPAPFNEVNLRAMDTLARAFGLPVGYSDHTLGIAVALAAVARGASVIEKHLTLDTHLPGPDHRASVEPHELKAMIEGIRAVEVALGDGRKLPTRSELKNVPIARKSLVAARPIRRGEVFTQDNLDMKRAGDGIPPTQYWDWLGRPAQRDYAQDDAIDGP